jgi:hypothetical protein
VTCQQRHVLAGMTVAEMRHTTACAAQQGACACLMHAAVQLSARAQHHKHHFHRASCFLVKNLAELQQWHRRSATGSLCRWAPSLPHWMLHPTGASIDVYAMQGSIVCDVCSLSAWPGMDGQPPGH